MSSMTLRYADGEVELAHSLWTVEGSVRLEILSLLSESLPDGFQSDFVADMVEMISCLEQQHCSCEAIAREVLFHIRTSDPDAVDDSGLMGRSDTESRASIRGKSSVRNPARRSARDHRT